MKKLLIFNIIVLLVIIAIGSYPVLGYKTTPDEGYVNAMKSTYLSKSQEQINKELDSMTAEGEGIVVRGADSNYETIKNHVRWIYVKDN